MRPVAEHCGRSRRRRAESVLELDMLELAAAGLVFGVLFAFFRGGWAFAANREIQNAWAYGLLPVVLFFWLGARYSKHG